MKRIEKRFKMLKKKEISDQDNFIELVRIKRDSHYT